MAESLRRYVANETELSQYVTISGTFDAETLRKAEIDIDNAVASFYEGVNRQYLIDNKPLTPAKITIDATSATIIGETPTDGEYSRTVLNILSGDDAGKQIFVSLSAKSGSDTTLTFTGAQTFTTVTPFSAACEIEQVAKFPRVGDSRLVDGTIFKQIPVWLKQAVAYQYNFRVDSPSNFVSVDEVIGYSVNRDGWSKSFGAPGSASNIDNRISPQAMDLLRQHGLTLQSF